MRLLHENRVSRLEAGFSGVTVASGIGVENSVDRMGHGLLRFDDGGLADLAVVTGFVYPEITEGKGIEKSALPMIAKGSAKKKGRGYTAPF